MKSIRTELMQTPIPNSDLIFSYDGLAMTFSDTSYLSSYVENEKMRCMLLEHLLKAAVGRNVANMIKKVFFIKRSLYPDSSA